MKEAIDTSALAEAIKWADFIELSRGPLAIPAYAEKLAGLYELILSSGGKMPADEAAKIISGKN